MGGQRRGCRHDPSSRLRNQSGPRPLVGGPLGATVLVLLKDVLSSSFGHWYLFLGAIFAGVALLMPRGIVGTILKLSETWRAGSPTPLAETEDVA